ncbi:MAG: hypothetical protein JZD41_02345 [Thermoproteus sp.]|nr:hypothetical protein [Thermoproteus sp.]
MSDIFEILNQIEREVEKILNTALLKTSAIIQSVREPWELYDRGDHYEIIIEAPGIPKEQIEVIEEPSGIRVIGSGEHRRINVYIPISGRVERAKYNNGLLSITVKKQGRKIQIE